MKLVKTVLHITLLLLSCLKVITVPAQSLSGIWSGKISRTTPYYRGVEDVEVQLYQDGKKFWGYSFVFRDTSRFVLYNVQGTLTKKKKLLSLFETGAPYYLLPRDFEPCRKEFELSYTKIGKTQYLTGRWSGAGNDTSCFPGEELLVVLQKIYKGSKMTVGHQYLNGFDILLKQRFISYIYEKYYQKYETIPPKAEPLVEAIQPGITAVPALPVLNNDSIVLERFLDIQQIIQLPDTVATITLYDNAIVDDDTVSVFVDKIPALLRQRISIKPLSFNITLREPGKPVEILMQAENLGSIPPNTAVMIIETAHKRYEVRLSASFEKHAVIILTYNSE